METDRPTRPLPLLQLVNLSLYWLGITSIWAGLDATILPTRIEELLGPDRLGLGIGLVRAAGVLMPIVIQPLLGTLSDHTVSRWGRRKPYILVGSVLDVVFLWGLATSHEFVALVAFYVLVQFSSNLAQGPFQGYMPDLVPARQVGLASGLMGLMIVLGQLAGTFIASLGLLLYPEGTPAIERMFWPTVGLGLLELATAIVLVVRVDAGPTGVPRHGRSWAAIARSTWGRDVLRHRSFVWLVLSRLAFLGGPATIVAFALPYLDRAMGMGPQVAGAFINVALLAVVVPTAATVIPAARLSDRVGRKPIIYAACALGAGGLLVVVLAPSVVVALPGLVAVGIGAGAFLAVDWALMTDIIPRESAGRYMGISNVGTALAGPIPAIAGGLLLDAVFRLDPAASPRVAYAVGIVLFVLAAVLLRPVDPASRRP